MFIYPCYCYLGENKLGILLMVLRDEIRTVSHTKSHSITSTTSHSTPPYQPFYSTASITTHSTPLYKSSYSNPQINPSVDRSTKPSAYSSSMSHSEDREIIHFYDKRDRYFEFTPYSYHGFHLDGAYWKTLNHYFQAQKFSSSDHRKKIQQAKTPEDATNLAKVSTD